MPFSDYEEKTWQVWVRKRYSMHAVFFHSTHFSMPWAHMKLLPDIQPESCRGKTTTENPSPLQTWIFTIIEALVCTKCDRKNPYLQMKCMPSQLPLSEDWASPLYVQQIARQVHFPSEEKGERPYKVFCSSSHREGAVPSTTCTVNQKRGRGSPVSPNVQVTLTPSTKNKSKAFYWLKCKKCIKIKSSGLMKGETAAGNVAWKKNGCFQSSGPVPLHASSSTAMCLIHHKSTFRHPFLIGKWKSQPKKRWERCCHIFRKQQWTCCPYLRVPAVNEAISLLPCMYVV